MLYDFKCSKCKHITILNQSIKETLPKVVPCEKCNADALYDWSKLKDNIIIPDKFKALGDYQKIDWNKHDKEIW